MTAPARVRLRRGYLDWARGVAVLIMIAVHLIDSWTGDPARRSAAFIWTIKIGGFGSTLFLFLAGTAVALSASSKVRATGDARRAARAVIGRGLEIFGLAFLFRLQSWLISGGPAWMLLRVDILNIMGLSIVAAAAVWGAAKRPPARFVAFAVITVAITLLTPPIRAFTPLAALPDPIEGYIRPIPVLVNFVLFPWAGFVFAGAIVGMAIDRSTTRSSETRLNLWFGILGAALFGGGYAGSLLPSIYPNSDFWTSSPSYYVMRLGVMLLIVALSYAWERRRETVGWSPVQQLGRSSLFIYWIHVEMVYGRLSAPLHHSLTYLQSFIGFVAFTLLMLLVSLVKDRALQWWSVSAVRPKLRLSGRN